MSLPVASMFGAILNDDGIVFSLRIHLHEV